MLRKPKALVWLALPLAFWLYFSHLSTAGLLGPDEPRYASVAREMARSGDWITPRLWGEPWFEKPALLYWMTGAAFRLGLGPELAPRLPVATLAILFLAFFWWIIDREFGPRPAWFATLILSTSAGWIGFSQIGVTDLPLTATYSAAMLLALPWIARGDGRWLPAVSAALALAVLSKGLVPLVLALPLLMRGRIRDLVHWRVVIPFFAIALPWYAFCYLRNGREFLEVFFWQHHIARFLSPALLHPQPWWFYIPILLGWLLPWTPLMAVVRPRWWRDPRRAFLIAWLLFGLLFFSASINKLPGYVLPLVPAAAVLLGLGLAESAEGAGWLALCAGLVVGYPLTASILPGAVVNGLSRANWTWQWIWIAPAAVAAVLAWTLARRFGSLPATAAIAVCAAAGILYLKGKALPELNQQASARGVWNEIAARAANVCIESVDRTWRYGLNYYSTDPLPDCADIPKPLLLRQLPGRPPHLAPAALVDRSLSPVVTSPFRN
jgi:4-amino-4-deoxy-L-arabinose transferase-like glycosyltransferase